MKTTRQELALKGISKITAETDLSTVYFLDNGWLVCVNDDGKEVTVKPDYLGQWDDRMEIDLNAGSCFYTLFFFSKRVLSGLEAYSPYGVSGRYEAAPASD